MNIVKFRLAWTSALAIGCFAVLAAIDLQLKHESGFGAVDLQKVWTAGAMQNVIAAWGSPRHAAMAGFGLGFDYLFMPAYGFAFYYGALSARDAFVRNPGLLWRAVTILALVPLAGALFDAAENALETYAVFNGATDALAMDAYVATTAKFVCFWIGFVLWVLGVISAFRKQPGATA